MKIIGVSTVKDEPNIGRTIRHLVSQGVTHVILSTDLGDHAYVDAHGQGATIEWTICQVPFDQGAEITRLAHAAADRGADWIVPFDADEYWTGNDCTIREALSVLSPMVDFTSAPMYQYVSPDFRHEKKKPLPKIAFRPCEGMVVAWGSHSVTGPSSYSTAVDLIVRELQYESYTHFLTKIDKARQLHAQPHMADHQHGSHMWRLCQMDEAQLKAEWDQMMSVPVVYDPIPGSDKWTT